MSKTHWKKLTNPNYLGVYALEDGKDITLTIKKVQNEMVTGSDGKKDECTVCHFVEDVKPMILNKTNMKRIEALYHTAYIEEWAGKRITITSESVKAFGTVTDALRIRTKLPDDFPICEECGSVITKLGKKTPKQYEEGSKAKFGKVLCLDCIKKEGEK